MCYPSVGYTNIYEEIYEVPVVYVDGEALAEYAADRAESHTIEPGDEYAGAPFSSPLPSPGIRIVHLREAV